MASLQILPSGKWRAQVAVAGKRRSRAFIGKADAEKWGSATEAALRLRRDLGIARVERTLASVIPRRVLVAQERVGHTERDIAEGAFPAESLAGVYFLLWKGRVVYVGQSIDVFGRISQHRRRGRAFDAYNYVPCPVAELAAVESDYIAALLPSGNWAL